MLRLVYFYSFYSSLLFSRLSNCNSLLSFSTSSCNHTLTQTSFFYLSDYISITYFISQTNTFEVFSSKRCPNSLFSLAPILSFFSFSYLSNHHYDCIVHIYSKFLILHICIFLDNLDPTFTLLPLSSLIPQKHFPKLSFIL